MTRPSDSPLLRGFWYIAMQGERLKPGAMQPITLLGEPVLVCRRPDGSVFALRNLCPHRGVPLHFGRFDGDTVTCAYHGWRFDGAGVCREIPSLSDASRVDPRRIRCGRYPAQEVQGLIWVYIPGPGEEGEPAAAVPRMPDFPDAAKPAVGVTMTFDCDVDQAVFGLIDPAHVAFVHTSWWWKKKAGLRPKEKSFEPAPLGWRMVRHRLPPENRLYRLLGDVVTTEIGFHLPGLRIEHIQGDRHSVVGLTAVAPVDETRTVVHHLIFGTMRWLHVLRPLALPFAKTFLGQDRGIMRKRDAGMRYNPTMMLVDDADAQMKWFHRLKREWREARAAGRAFENPLKPRTLRWKS